MRNRHRESDEWAWLATCLENAGTDLKSGNIESAGHELQAAARKVREKTQR